MFGVCVYMPVCAGFSAHVCILCVCVLMGTGRKEFPIGVLLIQSPRLSEAVSDHP